METEINREEVGSSLSGSPYMPRRLLLPDETAKLQALETELNRLYEQLFPIAEDYEERLDIVTMPQRCKSCVAIAQCPEWTFLPKYRATELYPEGIQWDSSCNISAEENMMTVSDCLSRIGRKGRSADNPIDAIVWDLRVLRDRTGTLLRTGSLQTIDSRIIRRTSFHLSDDDTLHALIDIPIGTNTPPLYSGSECVPLPGEAQAERSEEHGGSPESDCSTADHRDH